MDRSTQQEDSTSSVSCSAGNHDQRTFGSVLQDHLNLWQGSGLLSALNLLKTLTWPSTIPTYSLQSNLLGTFTLDFSAWSGMLTAIRSIIIAIAGFVAYRIIFVGSTMTATAESHLLLSDGHDRRASKTSGFLAGIRCWVLSMRLLASVGTGGLTVPVIADQYAWLLGATGLSQAIAIIAGAMGVRFLLQSVPFVRWGS